ncbi:WD40-repeat-containing domain protein [Phaeosphaeria sp. MPI-PUGE-AT-0046c]|nr:WD40-repeat-containing domain protein [Phaeosphaeria sp. MPI-PUGE-AT-0046c]
MWRSRHGDEDGHLSDSFDSNNSRFSDVSVQNGQESHVLAHPLSAPLVTASPRPVAQQAIRPKFTNQFSEEEEHLLIFLKEVKKFTWKQITSEFQKYYPSRVYHTLQSRYTTNINKRNRDEDPATLKLPSEWASEASIDWPSVRANKAQPSKPVARGRPSNDTGRVGRQPPTLDVVKPGMVRQLTENDYSSGGEVTMHVRRPRRAPPVNYDVRRRNRRSDDAIDEMHLNDGDTEELTIIDTPEISDSPSQTQSAAPAKAHVVINSPLHLDHDAHDAAIALRCQNSMGDKLPYLGIAERIFLQSTPDSWKWNQLASRSWQGMLVHVDFSTVETARVERALARDKRRTQKIRHSTQRRQLQSMLKSLVEPQLLRLAHDLQRCLPARSSDSIAAFLRDARAGKLPDSPQIVRLSAARPQNSMITRSIESTSTILRQRELGLQSRRGWTAASRSLTYPVKNKVMDTLGPSSYWTGASSDIHTVAWSPDGEKFAAGAVAVTDQDSMQYNRPNNLLFGSLAYNEIHELPCHSLARPIPTTGANSSHAMFVSQDPKLYTTVTSVAFAPCGSLMYSAGYDKSLCVWNLESSSSQPELALKLKRGEEVEMMAVNPHESGVLATASRKVDKAIRLVRLGEQYPRGFQVHSFQSDKATSRSDLNILPQALRFEPRFGTLLLAGFGANAREDSSGFDTTGDLCLWDIETHAQMSMYGSNKNVFDVAFNPNQRSMPLFAAGCVAGGNVNRGMRSVIRLFEHRTMDKYTSPVEIECRALDMNDVVWCPQDEHLIAAGCTDGRVYVWDLRNFNDPLRVLSHGPSLMPLQDGVPHERTDTGIRFLSWGDNATRLYSGSSDGVVKAWDVTQSVEDTFIKDLITADSGIMAGAFSPDFSKLLIGEVNGSVDVLEVGRDDCTTKDANKLRYVPYCGDQDLEGDAHGNSDERPIIPTSGVTEGDDLLRSQELQLVPMGNLPIRQVVQGPNYVGPYNCSIEAPALRQQALKFQMSLKTTPGTHCDIPSCKDALGKVNSEDFGDSGRSLDRIPNELRKQWLMDIPTGIIPGKTKCANCGRPALPSVSDDDSDGSALCERCSFSCFRCGAANAISPATPRVVCASCGGVWEAGTLGYECTEQPTSRGTKLDVPPLRRFGREILEDYTTEGTTYGDEMNALTDHYFSLTIDPL